MCILLSRKYLIPFLILIGLTGHSNSQITQKSELQEYVFKFDSKESYNYQFNIKTTVNYNMEIQSYKINNQIDLVLKWNIKLTPVSNEKKDIITLKLEPTDINADWHIKNNNQEIRISISGSNVTGTQNNQTIIDTKNNIGNELAGKYKSSITGIYLNGEMDINPKGKVVELRGEQEFIKYWTEKLETTSGGFFGIIFPEHPISPYEPWSINIIQKKLGTIMLEGEGINCPNTFKREQNSTKDIEEKIGVFTISAPFDKNNIIGFMDQGGNRIKVNITTYSRQASGLVKFDFDKGIVINSNYNINGNGLMSMSIQNNLIKADINISANAELNLLQ